METLSIIHHIFLPKHSNNFKARLLHNSILLSLAMFLVIVHSLLNILSSPSVAVLGYAANISPERVVELTNQKRSESGAGQLVLNDSLSNAARQKGLDMLEDNYWAHVSPDGTEPWDFFKSVGYSYRYAGENLARDFSNPESAVEAWMASPSHRDNMLSGKYTEIGVAVVEGPLNGKDTTLIVQLFGTPSSASPSIPVVAAEEVSVEPVTLNESDAQEPVVSQNIVPQPVVAANDFDIMKVITIAVVAITAIVLLFDMVLISRKGVTRVGGRTFAHLSFMAMILIILVVIKAGEII